MSTVRALTHRRTEAAAPLRRTRHAPRHLRVVPEERPAGGRSRGTTGAVVASLLFVGLFALAAFHTVLVSGQVRLDELQEQVAAQQEEYQRARLRVAELESPQRVADEARVRLGMVVPADVVYLMPEESGSPSAPALSEVSDDTWLEIKPYLERNT